MKSGEREFTDFAGIAMVGADSRVATGGMSRAPGVITFARSRVCEFIGESRWPAGTSHYRSAGRSSVQAP